MDGYVTIGWSFFSVKAEVRVSLNTMRAIGYFGIDIGYMCLDNVIMSIDEEKLIGEKMNKITGENKLCNF